MHLEMNLPSHCLSTKKPSLILESCFLCLCQIFYCLKRYPVSLSSWRTPDCRSPQEQIPSFSEYQGVLLNTLPLLSPAPAWGILDTTYLCPSIAG